MQNIMKNFKSQRILKRSYRGHTSLLTIPVPLIKIHASTWFICLLAIFRKFLKCISSLSILNLKIRKKNVWFDTGLASFNMLNKLTEMERKPRISVFMNCTNLNCINYHFSSYVVSRIWKPSTKEPINTWTDRQTQVDILLV